MLYDTDYGKIMPNYNVGMDFSWKYRSPYYIGVRVGLGIDVAASTFGGRMPAEYNGLGSYADGYTVPRSMEPDNMLVDVNYYFDRFTETQQMIIASVPVQLGLFIGDFSMFIGARAGIPVHGCYWQRVRNSHMSLYFPDTDVTIPAAGQLEPGTDIVGAEDVFEPITQAGNIARTVNGIQTLSKDAFPLYSYHITAMVDLNYSFKVGDNTDIGIGAYLEYDPIGYSPKATENTSLMEWHYDIDDHTNTPVYHRDYVSVLEANRADGVTMGETVGPQLVRKYNRASVGLRLSVSLWSVPLDFGKNYRKQQLYKVCMCDFF
ncbi:MAG: hypothetical protein J6T76_01155 [Paludibacteraceae bacterium]|nr:hypothetical protein [Paludibacteraceae bacterium]MBO7454991.1 hypothetical protein [Paludibacteraceae bacterium]